LIIDASVKNYWLLNQEGKTIAKIPAYGKYITMSKHFIYWKSVDDDDTISVQCLKRSGSEVQDLLRAAHYR
jgi:hypothetical protein